MKFDETSVSISAIGELKDKWFLELNKAMQPLDSAKLEGIQAHDVWVDQSQNQMSDRVVDSLIGRVFARRVLGRTNELKHKGNLAKAGERYLQALTLYEEVVPIYHLAYDLFELAYDENYT